MKGSAESGNDLVAKKLRTGEVAIWDSESKTVTLIAKVKSGAGIAEARVISGASFKALQEALGGVVALG